ncbi:MAG TPA: calcium-binding protein, partial [Gammaproteobacteria bacterium]
TWALDGTPTYSDGTTTLAITGFDTLQGGTGADTFTVSAASTFDLLGGTGADTFNINGALTGSASGEAGDDTFIVGAAGSITGAISGGTHAAGDTLEHLSGTNTWNITGAGAGAVNDVTGGFGGIENLSGGTGADDFVFQAGGSVAGDIDGGAGTDALDYSALATAISVNLASGAATATGGFAGIDVLTGSGNAGDTLTGTNGGDTWTITGTNAGNIGGAFAFSAIENLAGGTGSDTFNLDNDVSGTVTGGAGNDTFNYTTGAAIGTLTGGGDSDTLAGDNAANTWILSGASGGTLNTQAYASMENLTGGAGNDDFAFTGSGSVGGDINGGGGNDTLDYDALAGPVSVNLANSSASRINGQFASIEGVIGSTGADTLTGANNNNTWTVSTADGGSVDGIAFADIENLAGGTANDIFNLSAGVSDTIDGGAGNDAFNVAGSFTAPGATLTLVGETVSNAAAATISGARLVISANTIGSSANAVRTNVNSLSVAAGGSAFIIEANDVVLGTSSAGGTFALTTSGTLTLAGTLNAGTFDTSGLTGRLDVRGAASIVTDDTEIDLTPLVSIEAATGGGSLALDAGNADVRLENIGASNALNALNVAGGTIHALNVNTAGDQTYNGALTASGNLASSGGDIDVDGPVELLANSGMSGDDITVNGSVNGGFVLDLAATDSVTLNGDAGMTSALAGLEIAGANASIDTVITSGAQHYDAAMTVNGNLTGGDIRFTQDVHFTGATIVESDTIDFLGATGSVTGDGELTLIPLTDGADVDLGGTSGTLDLNTDALEGYDAGLVIGGIVTADSIVTRADQVTVGSDFSVGENGYLTIVSRSGVVLFDGTVSGGTLTLIAADPEGTITNGATNASDSLLLANDVILVAGATIGENGRDINVVSLSGPGSLEVAWGTAGADAFVNNIGNSMFESQGRPRALDIARKLDLAINANQQITSSAQNSANREQSGGLANEGFIDPSLFEDIALYEVSGTGITLPADQSEEEVFDNGPSMDCNTDDENCDMQGTTGAVGVTSPQ